MNNPDTLLITDDITESNKVEILFDSLDYPIKVIDFRNNMSSEEYSLYYKLIIVDKPNQDIFMGLNFFDNFRNSRDVPIIFLGFDEDNYNKELPKNFYFVSKPLNQKEFKLTVELAIYKYKMENALYESERRNGLLIENADDPIAIIKDDGTFVMVNMSGAKYYGDESSNFTGKNMWDLFPKEHADSQMRSIRKVIETCQGIVVDEKTIVNNQEKWFSTNIQPIVDFNGYVSSVQIVARDITKRKINEMKLKDRENFFSGILNDLHSFVAVLKPTGEIIFINNTPLELAGKKLDDLKGKIFYETSWWNYSDEIKSLLRNDIEECAAGNSIDHQIQINTLNGLVWIDFSMHPVFDLYGNVKYVVPEGRDISNIKNAKKALHKEKNRFMGLSENAPFGMVLIDRKGNYKYINPKFHELFGYDLDEIPNGKEWFKKAFPDIQKRHEAIITWKNDFKDALPGEKRPRTYEIASKSGEKKIIDFVPVLLENEEYLMTVNDVTERKMAENALKQSEERFRTVANSAVDAIIITDLNGSIVFCNESLQRIFGYNEQDIFGESVNMLMPGRYKDEFKRNQVQFKLTGRHTLSGKLFESYGRRKDGSEFPIEISITAWEVDNERFTTSIIRDITERKLVEYELKSSEEKFRQMSENIDEVFWIIDPKMSQLLYISPAYQSVWGCSRDSLFDNPRSWIESIHPEDRKKVVDTIFRNPSEVQSVAKAGIEYRIKRPDGSIRWIWGKALPLKNEKGKMQRIAGIAVDITRRKNAEDDYRNLFENVSVGVFRSKIGPQSKLVKANPALLEMFGYKKTELLAIKASYLFKDRDDKMKFDQTMIKFGRVKNVELKFKKKDGTPFTASVSAFVIKDDSGEINYYDGVIQDITKLKEIEKSIKIIDPIAIFEKAQ